MRKIGLSPYTFLNEAKEEIKYNVKTSLTNILFAKDQIGAHELISLDRVARKIEAVSDSESVLLEEEEYKLLKSAVEGFKNFHRWDKEFISRVLDAPEVPVEEKKV